MKSFFAWALGDFGSMDVSCFSEGGKAKIEIRGWLHPRLGECLMHFGVFEKPQSRQWTSVLGPRGAKADLRSEAKEIKCVEWPSDLTKVDEKVAGHVFCVCFF